MVDLSDHKAGRKGENMETVRCNDISDRKKKLLNKIVMIYAEQQNVQYQTAWKAMYNAYRFILGISVYSRHPIHSKGTYPLINRLKDEELSRCVDCAIHVCKRDQVVLPNYVYYYAENMEKSTSELLDWRSDNDAKTIQEGITVIPETPVTVAVSIEDKPVPKKRGRPRKNPAPNDLEKEVRINDGQIQIWA